MGLHRMMDYRTAIAETARVSSQFVIFHRTPVVIGQPEKIYRKTAYGVETLEIHFDEAEFVKLLGDAGLAVMATYSLSEDMRDGCGAAVRIYVCKKL